MGERQGQLPGPILPWAHSLTSKAHSRPSPSAGHGGNTATSHRLQRTVREAWEDEEDLLAEKAQQREATAIKRTFLPTPRWEQNKTSGHKKNQPQIHDEQTCR